MADKNFDIQIRVKASSEDAALSQVEKRLGNVSAKLKETSKAAQDQDKSFGGMIGNAVKLASAYVGISTAISFLKSSFHEAAQASKEFQDLTNGMKAAVKATDALVASTDEWLEVVEMASGVSKDRLIPSFNSLLQQTGNLSQAQNLLSIATGAAARGQTGFEEAVSNMIKTLEGKGIRGTDQFSLKLKEVAADGVITANEMSKLTAIYGDMGAAVDNEAMQLQRAKLEWDRTKESMGNAMQGVIIPLVPVVKALSVALLMVADGCVQATLMWMKFIQISSAGIIHFKDTEASLKKVSESLRDGMAKSLETVSTSMAGVKTTMQGFKDIKLPGTDKKDNENLDRTIKQYEIILEELQWIQDALEPKRKPYTPTEIKAGATGSEELERFQSLKEQEEEINRKSNSQMNAEELRAKIRLYAQLKAQAIKSGNEHKLIDRDLLKTKIQLGLLETEARIQQLQGMVSAHSSAGKVLFRMAQAVGVAKALMAAPEAYSKDVATYGSPLGHVLGAIDAAICVAQAAAIASQKPPSAAGGWAVPKGVDPMTQIHGGEHILPARLAETYEKLAEMGFERVTNQNYGGNRTYNITAPFGFAGKREMMKEIRRAEVHEKNLRLDGGK